MRSLRPCKVFFAQKHGIWAKLRPLQKLGKGRNLSNSLCKLCHLNLFNIGCGKLLWINLWRMWKSVRFQQVFCLFVPKRQVWKKQKTELFCGHNRVAHRVTSIPTTCQLETKILEIVLFHREIVCLKGGHSFSAPLFLWKTAKKENRIIRALPGNTFPTNFFRR